jgi:hypothetical protein
MVTDIGSGVYRMIKTIKEQLNKDVELVPTETEFIVSIPRIVNTNYEFIIGSLLVNPYLLRCLLGRTRFLWLD